MEQLDTNLDALDFPDLTEEEIAEIDRYADESGVNLWSKSSDDSAGADATDED